MKRYTGQRAAAALALAALGALGGCTSMGGAKTQAQAQAPHYRCGQGIEFTARFVDDTVEISGPRGQEVLPRDAGGQGPQQAVFSGARVRAEFGLGAGAREARLQYFEPPLLLSCQRD